MLNVSMFKMLRRYQYKLPKLRTLEISYSFLIKNSIIIFLNGLCSFSLQNNCENIFDPPTKISTSTLLCSEWSIELLPSHTVLCEYHTNSSQNIPYILVPIEINDFDYNLRVLICKSDRFFIFTLTSTAQEW